MARTLTAGQVVITDEERRDKGDFHAFVEASERLLKAYEKIARGIGKGARFILTLTVEQKAADEEA